MQKLFITLTETAEPVVTFGQKIVDFATKWMPVFVVGVIVAVAAYIAFKWYKKRR